ncbi:MAG: precorrin-3B C(17)-methyltransferase, partial [Rhodobacteraceae bacterium]|nr:precorrin-3B C(17)-methyltransferase [Paracoccaceae bacterium]
MAQPRPRVFCLTASGYEVARQVAEAVDGEVRLSASAQVDTACARYSNLATAMRSAFVGGHAVIGVCAAAIVVRILAPALSRKKLDPPVLCIPEDGNSVIPLLGGHQGANRMAMVLGDMLGAHKAISTASDLRLGVALDCPPQGWRLHNPSDIKDTTLAILGGAPTVVAGSAEWLAKLGDLPNVTQIDGTESDGLIFIQADNLPPLVYCKRHHTLGIGCVRGCSFESLRELVAATLDKAGIAWASIAGVYSVDLKSDEPAIHELASELGVPARFFESQRLEAERVRLSRPSEIVFREVGCHGVCEGACLAAAGPEGELIVPKTKSAVATCAVARMGDAPGDRGVSRGRLDIIGVGPGDARWRTPQAILAIARADLIAGYSGYLDLIADLLDENANTVAFSLGQEIDRCRFALEQAALGRRVALICSGDSGIYAMAPLVLELLSLNANQGGVSAAARRVKVVCVPGVSAMQAASAQAGAMLGHDFCAISLSDLLTPRDLIVKRIVAAARGDFVVAFYNPASVRRRELLPKAIDILLEHRTASTPVVVARNVGRSDELVNGRTLTDFDPAEVDMSTIVIVGNSRSTMLSLNERPSKPGQRL